MTLHTDTQMHKDVVDELAFEPSLNAERVAVAVQNGIVTLSGSVSTFVQICAAEQAVRRVRGIKGLAEELTVQPQPGLDDTDIAGAARHALAWDVILDDKRIQIRVEEGCVQLEGELTWPFERERAQTVVAHLRGVKGVINLITVRSDAAPGNLATTLEAAFKRSTDWADIDTASLTAWRAKGVTSVDNQIMVG